MTVVSAVQSATPRVCAHHDHVVQFYDNDEFLHEVVGAFLSDGLVLGQPLVVIATAEHRAAFAQQLQASGFDVAGLLESGQFVALDAQDTLATFMDGSMPDAARFKQTVGGLIAGLQARSDQKAIRAYGEMVDLLWRDGNPVGAIRLEELWNELAEAHTFELLCAYSMGNFYRESYTEHFTAIVEQHAQALPTESFARLAAPDLRAREITKLQQRARALEAEIEHRKRLELALREAYAERRQVEEALRQSEHELRDFLENAVEGLHWVGPDGVILWANRAELELLGYSAEEYIGHNIAEFHMDEQVVSDIMARLSRDEVLQEYEARLRCRDGSIKCVLINSNVYHRDGNFAHTRCFTRDITARTEAEAALRQAKEEAERASRVKTEFLAVMSHELRTPLNAIIGYGQLLAEEISGPVTERQREQLNRIKLSATHLLRLIDDVLDLSKIESGKLEFSPQALPLAEIVSSVSRIVEPQLRDKKILLETEVAPSTIVYADVDKVRQILLNLVVNAWKFTPAGGRIRLATAPGQKGQVLIQVTDNGMGIPLDRQEAIFDAFVQVDSSHTRNSSGAGLGLTISRKFARGMGGDLTVASRPGEGSTFTLSLKTEL